MRVTAQQLPLRTYTTADGLAADRVLRIVRDRRGFLWFCTAGGLSQFDGERFTTYDPDNGLPFSTVNDLLIDRRGAYLVASNGAGIIRFDVSARAAGETASASDGRPGRERWRFRAYRISAEAPTNRVNRLFEDRAGRIWAGTDAGLFVAPAWKEPPSFARVTLFDRSRDRGVQVWALVEDREGSLWIGSTAGLTRRLPDGRLVHYQWSIRDPRRRFPQLSWVRGRAMNVWALELDREGRLWVGHEGGLTVIKPETVAEIDMGVSPVIAIDVEDAAASAAHQTLPARAGEVRSWSQACVSMPVPVMALAMGRDGHMWISGRDRIVEFDGRAFHPYEVPMRLAAGDVAGIVEDEDGRIWTGTLTDGAIRLSRSGFATFHETRGGVSRSLFETSDGRLCVYVRDSQAVRCFDGRRFALAAPEASFLRPPLLHLRALRQDRRGAWWVASRDGLRRYPPHVSLGELAHTRPLHRYTVGDGLISHDVVTLFEDSRGDMWIGSFRTGRQVLTRWERSTDRLHHYSDRDGLPPFCAPWSFAEDRAGGIWILFREGHVARYHNGQFTLLRQGVGLPLASGFIHVDERGRLWVALGDGVLRVDRPDAGLLNGVRYTTSHGLSTNGVNAIAEERGGRLYLGSSRGVDRLDPETGQVWHYSVADGLAGHEVTRGLRDRSGALWFSGPAGISRLVPRPEPSRRAPSVAIRSAVVADRDVPIGALGDTAVSLGSLAGASPLQIDFFGSSFGTGALRYQYRLEGADESWSAPSPLRSVRYARLAPGRYRFVVRAVNPDGLQSPRPGAVTFHVLPPVWQRWWFLLLVGGMGALVVRTGVRRRIARLLEFERLRTRLATDLHDEIGSNLSQIAVLSEVVQQQVQNVAPSVPERLSHIASVSRQSVEAMGDIVWALDPQRDSLTDLAQRMRRFANDLLTPRDVAVRFESPSSRQDLALEADIRRDLFLFFKECVHNVVRHAEATEAHVVFDVGPRRLVLAVRDNGKGFSLGDGSHGLGQRSMRQRALRLGGQLDVTSTNGHGTCITLTVPLAGRPSRWRTRRAAAPG
jgi:ligand-binding sensor domain-containing protein/two-component sensor histidine kinase